MFRLIAAPGIAELPAATERELQIVFFLITLVPFALYTSAALSVWVFFYHRHLRKGQFSIAALLVLTGLLAIGVPLLGCVDLPSWWLEP